MFFVICNLVYIIGINDSLLSIFIYFSKTQIKKEKKRYFDKFLLYIVKLK